MTKKRVALGVLVIMIALAAPALSGGYLQQTISFLHYYPILPCILPDGNITAAFSNNYIESGSSPKSFLEATAVTLPPERSTDFQTTLESKDVYFAAISGNESQIISTNGGSKSDTSASVKTYIIMPDKFDSNQSINVQFLHGNTPQAELVTNFTYENVKYSFTKAIDLHEGDNKLELFLQPFCDEFEGLGISYSKTYEDSVSSNGLNIAGSLTMEAKKV